MFVPRSISLDTPPLFRTRRGEVVHFFDGDEPRRIVVERFYDRLEPVDVDPLQRPLVFVSQPALDSV